MVGLRRVYDEPRDNEGKRYLVDRVWPRGIKKEALGLAAWLREIAPSPGLRKWFSHDPNRWEEFRRRFRRELEDPEKGQILERLAREARQGTVTLLFAARNPGQNNAVVIRELVEEKTAGEGDCGAHGS